MAAEPDYLAIKPTDHLLLDQPLLRLPYELLRKNFRSAHFTIEREASFLKTALRDAATASVSGRAAPADTLRALDSALARLQAARRRIVSLAEEESSLHAQLQARTAHLDDLGRAGHSTGNNANNSSDTITLAVDDVAYENWNRRRLDRLIVDYLLRQGYEDSAIELAADRNMQKLVDTNAFVVIGKIRSSLEGGNVAEALAWCQENKKELRKMESNLEFMLRFQQYIELIRPQSPAKTIEAINHAKKYLFPSRETYPTEVSQAAGLLAYPPNSLQANAVDTYRHLYSPSRWKMLADLFTQAHNDLLSLPSVPLLHIALSAGLSALKTPACHTTSLETAAAAADSSMTSSVSTGSSSHDGDVPPTLPLPEPPLLHRHTGPPAQPGRAICPICSAELNELARHVPCAHHAQSHIEPDQMLLPNGHAYSIDRLTAHSRLAGLPWNQVKDLRTGEVFPANKLKKVFIT